MGNLQTALKSPFCQKCPNISRSDPFVYTVRTIRESTLATISCLICRGQHLKGAKGGIYHCWKQHGITISFVWVFLCCAGSQYNRVSVIPPTKISYFRFYFCMQPYQYRILVISI